MIKNNSVVSLAYSLTNPEGEELDRADSNEPLSYLHGGGQIVPGLEKALEGLNVGDKKDVTVSPNDGYGEVYPELKLKVDKSNFPEGTELEPGMRFMAEINEGKQHPFTVQEIEGEQVLIDGNHPLAGQTLHFSVEVVDVREATEEEIQHGHVHGEGGEEH